MVHSWRCSSLPHAVLVREQHRRRVQWGSRPRRRDGYPQPHEPVRRGGDVGVLSLWYSMLASFKAEGEFAWPTSGTTMHMHTPRGNVHVASSARGQQHKMCCPNLPSITTAARLSKCNRRDQSVKQPHTPTKHTQESEERPQSAMLMQNHFCELWEIRKMITCVYISFRASS